MTNFTLDSLKYITRERLASMIQSDASGISIIDVRDSDYIGGHIINCQNIPTHVQDYRIPELVRTLRDQNTVVFHCALSQQRGPASALRYLRERERMNEKGEVGIRKDGEELVRAQKVYVLEGGFVKWQEVYGEDSKLTEGYVKEIWANE